MVEDRILSRAYTSPLLSYVSIRPVALFRCSSSLLVLSAALLSFFLCRPSSLSIVSYHGHTFSFDQSGLSISGKPVYHFVITSIFNGYAVIHFGRIAKIDPESPLNKVCVLSCGSLTGLDATFNVTRPLKGFTVVIFVLATVALLAAQGDRLAGASHIIGVDLNPNKFDPWARTNLEEIVSEKVKNYEAAAPGGPNHDEAEAGCILTRLKQLDQIFKH